MKLSEFKGEDALDVLADIISPATEIINDAEVKAMYKERNLAKCCEIILKKHREAAIAILSATRQETPEEYLKKVTVFSVPLHLAELISDDVLLSFFLPAPVMKEAESSGDVTENTGETA